MENKRTLFAACLGFTLCMLVFVPFGTVSAQQACQAPDVSMDIQLSSILESVEVLSLQTLGIDSKGQGPALISAVIQNNENQEIDNLFFEGSLEASKVGVIADVESNSNNPFSLRRNQTIRANNNHLERESIPGVKENLVFDGGLTPEGEDFIENLENITELPADVYIINARLYRRTAECGEQLLDAATAEIDVTSVGGSDLSIYLKTPGDVVGGEAEITNPYPQFSWDGSPGAKYRLIVVSDDGDNSPESLIESARSTDPTSDGGSLLQHENLDTDVNRDTYQYPASGAQPLEVGKTYYWQVIAQVRSGKVVEERNSEIWSFVLSDPENVTNAVSMNDETRRALIRLLGGSGFGELQKNGFSLSEMEIDGVVLSGPELALKLEELLRKIQDEEIIVGEEQ